MDVFPCGLIGCKSCGTTENGPNNHQLPDDCMTRRPNSTKRRFNADDDDIECESTNNRFSRQISEFVDCEVELLRLKNCEDQVSVPTFIEEKLNNHSS